ncbi:hypothetical protein [Streptomyces sp. NPDC088775]|uniref:hypothetical protein n=1 Tax=Streptomyces sp. NPDC088775 TaxID=3365896 RepID=UPI00381D6FDC
MPDVYVAVSDLPYDKMIKYGPIMLDDPSQFPGQTGNHVMLESEALAAGYYYNPDGALAPEQPAGQGAEHRKHGKRGKSGMHPRRDNQHEQ